jgi:hypothetical protein
MHWRRQHKEVSFVLPLDLNGDGIDFAVEAVQ